MGLIDSQFFLENLHINKTQFYWKRFKQNCTKHLDLRNIYIYSVTRMTFIAELFKRLLLHQMVEVFFFDFIFLRCVIFYFIFYNFSFTLYIHIIMFFLNLQFILLLFSVNFFSNENNFYFSFLCCFLNILQK